MNLFAIDRRRGANLALACTARILPRPKGFQVITDANGTECSDAPFAVRHAMLAVRNVMGA